MLTVQAFEAVRRPGSPDIDAAVSQRLGWELEKLQVVPMRAWVMVCIDGTGALAAVAPVKRYAPYEHAVAVSNAFVDVVGHTWTFRPVELNGRVTPACSLVLLSYPVTSGLPVPPLPAPPLPGPGVETPPAELLPDALAGIRISSERSIPPDDVTITQMRRMGSGPVTSSFQLCLNARGAVTGIVMLESSGFPRYDAKVQREMQQWRFKPYRFRGRPAAICAPFAFRYDPPPERQSPGAP
jgi:TonB family protein